MKNPGYFISNQYDGSEQIVVFRRLVPNEPATLAIDLLARWGAVASEIDGEDSAGRQKGRLQTPAEIVERACNVAEAALAEFEARDWLVELPEPKPPSR